MNANFKKAFLDEAQEIFITLENDLISLEINTGDKELVNKIFRELHTLKGSGAMFGFTQLSTFAHELETLFDQIRNNKITISKEIVSVSLESLDLLKTYCTDDDEIKVDIELETELKRIINSFISGVLDTKSNEKDKMNSEKMIEPERQKIFRIYFKPEDEILIKGTNPTALFRNLMLLGKLYSFTHVEDIPLINEINPELCYTDWTCLLITSVSIEQVRDVFIFVEDNSDIKISEIYSSISDIEQSSIPVIGQILLSKGDICQKDIDAVINSRKLFGEQAVDMGFTSKDKIASALFEQKTIGEIKKEIVHHNSTSSIRVQNEKLDILTNEVSELVTLQARLNQLSENRKESELTTISEYMEKLTSSLRDTVMMIRMVPVQDGFTSMHRLVHDLSRDLKKNVRLSILGGDTELDKTVIDNLKDPMMHLIRNCIDHGLEFPDERLACGKPETGNVTIKAEHFGSHVIISVVDDGRGLDTQKILSKAIERGIVSLQNNLSESEINKLIFLPGFSTAEKATSVSGRGVGMDVVKKNVDSIRGEIFVETVKGAGTTIQMKLPITLAIIDGLLFSVGDELFVINISSVYECLELTQEIKSFSGGQNILKLRDKIIPYVYLRDILNIPGESLEHQQIIVVNTHDQVMGFVVDSVEGKHQTVVKSTSRLFSNVKEVTGATILGDGRIALILDVNILSRKADKKIFQDELREVA